MLRILRWLFGKGCYHCGSLQTDYHDEGILNSGQWDENKMACYRKCRNCGKTS